MNPESTFTHSRLEAFLRCPFAHALHFGHGIIPDRQGKALRFGSAVHKALDAWFRCESEDTSIVWETVEEYYKGSGELDGADLYAITSAGCLVLNYIDFWEGVGISETVYSELPFQLALENDATYAGVIDRIVRDKSGRLMILETKTTSQNIDPGQSYRSKLRMDQQISRYFLAARAMGIEVEGIIYDMIRKPSFSVHSVPKLDENRKKIVFYDGTTERVLNKNGTPRQTGGEGMEIQTRPMTQSEWNYKLNNDISARPDWYFQREEVGRLWADLHRAEQDVAALVNVIRHCNANGFAPKNTSSCVTPYKCRYFALCSSGFVPEFNAPLPEGFVYTDELFPELSEMKGEHENGKNAATANRGE